MRQPCIDPLRYGVPRSTDPTRVTSDRHQRRFAFDCRQSIDGGLDAQPVNDLPPRRYEEISEREEKIVVDTHDLSPIATLGAMAAGSGPPGRQAPRPLPTRCNVSSAGLVTANRHSPSAEPIGTYRSSPAGSLRSCERSEGAIFFLNTWLRKSRTCAVYVLIRLPK